MPEVSIDEIAVPATLADPGGVDFEAAIEVRNEVETHEFGTAEMCVSAADALPTYLDVAQPKRIFLARTQGRVVARGVYECIAGEPGVAWLDVRVAPAFRRRGIGSAMAATLESLGQGSGGSKLITYAPCPEAPGERLPSPTGFGSLPKAAAGVRFLLGRGYSLEQVVRVSRLDLPAPDQQLRALIDRAASAAGPDYRIHQWTGRTPPEWIADVADLRTAMSVEEPSAGLEEPLNVWTAERVQDADDRAALGSERQLVTAVEHEPTGHLVGITSVGVPAGLTEVVRQQDTLVVAGHRGRRLGLLVKARNLAYISDTHPGHPAVIAFNAEENAPMLAVNEAVGFHPIGYEGAWLRKLA